MSQGEAQHAQRPGSKPHAGCQPTESAATPAGAPNFAEREVSLEGLL